PPRGATALAADALRPRDDRGARLLQRHRELLAPPVGTERRRAAADADRLLPERLSDDHRRVAPDRAAGARDVGRRPLAQPDARRARRPPAERDRPPPA